YLERTILVQIFDQYWKAHLLNMDHLKEGIYLRGYAQKDPLNEYKREGFALFEGLLNRIKQETVAILARVEVNQPDEMERLEEERALHQNKRMTLNHPESDHWGGDAPPPLPTEEGGSQEPFRRDGDKVGRNSPCPCGSGKKYKQCCGVI
ncbi:MAG: SEC-C domain-containing protein, partial [Magnetococcales bacterium]|nr:SEC-C domain-containing protein [Magnetococcales bacterium]